MEAKVKLTDLKIKEAIYVPLKNSKQQVRMHAYGYPGNLKISRTENVDVLMFCSSGNYNYGQAGLSVVVDL
jgi:hypothetical protein